MGHPGGVRDVIRISVGNEYGPLLWGEERPFKQAEFLERHLAATETGEGCGPNLAYRAKFTLAKDVLISTFSRWAGCKGHPASLGVSQVRLVDLGLQREDRVYAVANAFFELASMHSEHYRWVEGRLAEGVKSQDPGFGDEVRSRLCGSSSFCDRYTFRLVDVVSDQLVRFMEKHPGRLALDMGYPWDQILAFSTLMAAIVKREQMACEVGGGGGSTVGLQYAVASNGLLDWKIVGATPQMFDWDTVLSEMG